jgi:hypothetical protein
MLTVAYSFVLTVAYGKHPSVFIDLDWGGEGDLRFLPTSGINSIVTRLTELPAAALRLSLCLSVPPFSEPITVCNIAQHVPQAC